MAPARIALVTGAARGIGRSIALQLASDGLDVAVNDTPSNRIALESVVSEIEATGRRGLALTADVSDEAQVKNMVARVVRRLGGLDVMVANAGICEPSSILDISLESYERTFSINVRGVLLCYKYAAIQMIEQGRGGRIIGALSSHFLSVTEPYSISGSSLIGGLQAPSTLLAYSSSKFAVRGLTQSSAVELAKYRITVNAYAPGSIDTPISAKYPEGFARDPNDYPRFTLGAPVGRVGQPTNIAQVVSFFASERASYVTGQMVSPDGGSFLT
ncbi:NAD-binding protein [Amylostereum chailletii]|nr:NAD-binding protein [Amylostereum chailletii]